MVRPGIDSDSTSIVTITSMLASQQMAGYAGETAEYDNFIFLPTVMWTGGGARGDSEVQ